MRKIRLWYTDFYKGFDPANNYFQNLLSKHYEIILDTIEPDYLIFSCYSKEFLNYKNSVRIFYTGENLVPDFNLCDYGIGFSYLEFGDRYLRYPNFALIEAQFEQLIKPKGFSKEDLRKKEYFCNFIYSNAKADPARDHFFQLLSKYKKVVSPGSHLNNASMDIGNRYTEDWMYTKLNFQSKCKFSIAFENSSSPGYTTEKLMHTYITNSIPIYWGNPGVTRDFNPRSLINSHDFNSFEEVIERVIEIDKNEELALKYLNEPPFHQNQIPQNLKVKTLEKFLLNIFDQEPAEAYRRPKFGTILKYERSFIATEKEKQANLLSILRRNLKGKRN